MSQKFTNFYVRSSIFTVLSAAGAVLSYLLYPAISRILNVTQFGDFTAIIALSNQILSVLLAFNIISIYLVKHHPQNEARELVQTIQKILIWIFTSVILIFMLISPLVNSWLKINSISYFAILAMVLLISIPSTLWTGYLQGHKKLIHIGIFTFSASFVKLCAGVALSFSFGVAGGLFGVFLGTLIGLIVLRIISPIDMPGVGSTLTKISHNEIKFLRKNVFYIVNCILAIGALVILQSIDITYAKLLLSPEIAGSYSGISIIAYVIYYVFMLLVWILLPEINPLDNDHNKQLLKKAYLIIGCVSVSAIISICFLHDFVLDIALGESFSTYSGLLPFTISYQTLLVSVTLYVFYRLILHKKDAILLALLVAIPCIVAPPLIADSPLELIITLLASLSSGVLVYILLRIIRGSHSRKSDR